MSTQPATTNDPAYAPPPSTDDGVDASHGIDAGDPRVLRITTSDGRVLEIPRPTEPPPSPGSEHAEGADALLGELLPELSASARDALALADGFRLRAGRRALDLEHLLAGLLAQDGRSVHEAFERAGVGATDFTARLDALGRDAPGVMLAGAGGPAGDLKPALRDRTPLAPPPPVTVDVARALSAAREAARTDDFVSGPFAVHLRHLLRGVMGVTESPVVQLFADVWPHAEEVLHRLEHAEGRAEEEEATPPTTIRALGDDHLRELVDSLSASTRKALGVADAFRGARDTVHVEHLLVGTYVEHGGHQWFAFDAAELPPEELARRLGRFEPVIGVSGVDGGSSGTRLRIPGADPIRAMPPLSKHSRLALSAAAFAAGWEPGRPQHEGLVRARHLLTGILALRECSVSRAFADARPAILAALATRIDQDVASGEFPADLASEEHRRLDLLLADPPAFRFEPLAPAPRPATTRLVGAGRGGTNDSAVGEDRLGFSYYVRAFADLIDSPDTDPPLTVGIYGAWGAGKSFLLGRLRDEMRRRGALLRPAGWRAMARHVARQEGEPDGTRERSYVYSVTFNAWEYNAADHIWPRLVRRVLDEVDGAVRWSTRPDLWWRKVRRKLGRNLAAKLPGAGRHLLAWLAVAVVLAWIAYGIRADRQADALQFLTGLKLDSDTFTLTTIVAAVATLFKLVRDTVFAPLGSWVTALTGDGIRYGAERDYMGAIRADLDLLGDQLESENARVLIIIDDLDRCEPEKAVEILQAINLLLDRDRFIVCLGIDARIITAAVERHYHDLLGPAGLTGYEYLDKIVQIPFRIPDPNPTELADFLRKQLRRADGDAKATPATRPRPDSTTQTDPPTDPPTVPPARRDGATTIGTGRETGPAPTTDGARRPPSPASAPPPPGTPRRPERVPSQAAEHPDPSPRGDQAPPAPSLEVLPALSFTPGELRAFAEVTRYLRPNPRHVKRLVNVYALVRSLAELREERRILDDPGATVRWLTLCGQWPYATRELLRATREIERGLAPPLATGTPSLQQLLARVAPALEPSRRRRFDHSPELLDELVATSGELSWDELLVLRGYTVNFNPALESELHAADGPLRASAEG